VRKSASERHQISNERRALPGTSASFLSLASVIPIVVTRASRACGRARIARRVVTCDERRVGADTEPPDTSLLGSADFDHARLTLERELDHGAVREVVRTDRECHRTDRVGSAHSEESSRSIIVIVVIVSIESERNRHAGHSRWSLANPDTLSVDSSNAAFADEQTCDGEAVADQPRHTTRTRRM
jgi:hypothetical protein